MRNGYSIKHLDPVNPGDQVKPTRQWQFPNDWTMSQITFYERAAGCQFGGHVHHGSDLSKSPELLLLVRGRMKVKFVGLDGQTEEVEIGEWDFLTIDPGVVHSMKAMTNVVICEPRRTLFNRECPDTYPVAAEAAPC